MKYLHYLIIFLSINGFAENSFYRATKENPYHFSVGAVLFNDEGKVACHHFDKVFGVRNIYILMRETMENGESPLETLARGLREEFSATAEPIAFLGTICGTLETRDLTFEKTTSYVACRLVDWQPENRDLNDSEGTSVIEWIEPESLIAILKAQGLKYPKRSDLDESEIVRRALPYIKLVN